MLIRQPYLLACQLASSTDDGQTAAPGQSVPGSVPIMTDTIQGHWAWSRLRLCWQWKGLTYPTPDILVLKDVRQEEFRRRWIRRTEKEWLACTCRRSRMTTMPHSVRSRHTPCPTNVPGSMAPRLSYLLQEIFGCICLSTLNLWVRAFPFIFCISTSKKCNSEHLEHHYD